MPLGAFRLNTLSAALAAAAAPFIRATGGTVTTPTISGVTYKVHTFDAGTTNFVVTGTGAVDVLLIGAGGAGGGAQANYAAGGGGAGQVRQQLSVPVTSQTYSIVAPSGSTGAIGSTGATGGNATAFGFTAFGGSGGSTSGTGPSNANGAAGGGAGSNFGTSTKAGGTGTFAGGSARGTGMSGYSGGGGGGSTSAGGNGDSTNGGSGGNGTTFTDFHVAGSVTYAGGGGAGGTDARGSGGSGGGGPGTLNANNNTVGAATNYGSGGGGSVDQGGNNRFGGNGFAGVVIVRYPIVPVTSISYITTITAYGTSAATTITMPSQAQEGDIAVFINHATQASATTPALYTPSGNWTNAINSTGGSFSSRFAIWYKVLTASDLNVTHTLNLGTASKKASFSIYRSNVPVNTLTYTTLGQYSGDATPPNQTLTMTGQVGPYVAFAYYGAIQSITNRGSTTTATREITYSVNGYLKTFEATSSSVSFSTSTISMADHGTNQVYSFRLNIS